MKEFLPLISKPVRYLGQEINSVRKDPSEVKLRFCLAFPDVYEVGMSHLGIRILYHILNQRKEVACERAFAPWVDMERHLREKGAPLCSLESSLPLNQFDLLGFSVQYELSFTNILNMLDLCRIPLYAKERDERFPLIIAGGPCVYNPEPIADFFDAFVIGDGEEAVVEICDLAIPWKEAKAKKTDLLESLSRLDGIYVPVLHDGRRVRKRLVSDLNHAPFPTCPIVPYMRVVHDRLNVEIARGCKRGCRFCQAGFIHRPYRERAPAVIQKILYDSLKRTGYEEVSLLSLSAGDYSSIGLLLTSLMDRLESRKVAVSFPSLRIEKIVVDLAEQVKRVRKTGLTLALEAATERLRSVINKEIDEEVVFRGLSDLFVKGWNTLKLYFMMGLPTETENDLRGIVELSRRISALGRREKIHPHLNVSVSTFVPKAHTPFQWEAQIPLEEMKEKLGFLKDELKRNRLHLKWQDPHLSLLEGVFSRGDRSLSRVLVEAHRLGCRFDGWSDRFQFPLWKEAFERTGVDMNLYRRRRAFDEPLPWSFIGTGIEPSFFWRELQKGLKEEISPPCSGEDCRRCGICNGTTVRVREHEAGTTGLFTRTAGREPRRKAIRKKVRLRFTKKGETCFLSHLELAQLFYRASKRADLPLCYSEGFHPMPRIIFAAALPVGVESLLEIVDLELEGPITSHEVTERLGPHLPHGIEILGAEEVLLNIPFSPLPGRSTYWISLDHFLTREEVASRVSKALENKPIVIEQERKAKKRSLDLRPLIDRMEVKEDGRGGLELELVLRREGRTAKPSEVIGAVLGLEGEALSRCRIVKIE